MITDIFLLLLEAFLFIIIGIINILSFILSDINLLNFLIINLLFGSFILLLWPSNEKKYLKIFTLNFLFFSFFFSLIILLTFNSSTTKFQFIVNFLWFNQLNINCFFGIDGISIFLVIFPNYNIYLQFFRFG